MWSSGASAPSPPWPQNVFQMSSLDQRFCSSTFRLCTRKLVLPPSRNMWTGLQSAPGKRCSRHLGKCGQVYSVHQENCAPAILEHVDRFTVRTRKTLLPPYWKMRTGLQCTPGKWCSRHLGTCGQVRVIQYTHEAQCTVVKLS